MTSICSARNVFAIAASALAIGEWRGVLALLIMTLNYWVKARREDRILSGKFGSAFEEHRRLAGFLVPKE